MGWLVWLAAASALAGKLGRAERGLEEIEAGSDRHAQRTVMLVDHLLARGAVDDPAVWLLKGRIYQGLQAIGVEPSGSPAIDPLTVVLDSYTRAVDLVTPTGSARTREVDALVLGGLSEEVHALDDELAAMLLNAVEAKDWSSAEQLFGFSTRVRVLDERLRGPTPERRTQLHAMGVRLEVGLGRPDEAAMQYAEYVAALGADDIALACAVARSWSEYNELSKAVAFLDPLSKRHPQDEVLLRTQVDLMVRNDQRASAVTQVEQVWSSLSESTSGAFLAAHLFLDLGRIDRARVALERVLEIDPRHMDAQVALGRTLTQMAVQRRDDLRSRAEEFEQRSPSREVLTQLGAVVQLWSEAERHLLTARDLDPTSAGALEALIALYEAKIAGFDEEAANRAEMLALALDRNKLEAAHSALAALGGR